MYKILPSKPRYDFAIRKAYELLKRLNITRYPINLFDVYRSMGFALFSIQDAAVLVASSLSSLRWLISEEAFHRMSADALTTIVPNVGYVTFYDANKMQDRINFTLAHELGHIILGHCIDFKETQYYRSGLSDTQYETLEREADTFAGAFIRPARLVRILNNKYQKLSRLDIQNIFSISSEAALVCTQKAERIGQLPAAHREKYINFFNNQFYRYINAKYCSHCYNHFISNTACFCPICGSKTLFWDNEKTLIFDFIKNNKEEVPRMTYNKYSENYDLFSGHVTKCPRCENEELQNIWSFCPICGLETENKCSVCNTSLLPYYRFCPECGNESEYFKEQVIISWEKEKEESTLDYYDSNDIPF